MAVDASGLDGPALDDDESADAAPLDLTPQPGRDVAPRARSTRAPWLKVALLAAVVVAIGVVLANGLGNATTFFYNVDEAVEKRSEIGDRRVRVQGNVIKGSIDQRDNGVAFTLSYNGSSVDIDHRGDTPDLFGPEIPVVVEGRFVGDRFRSEKILVKHDENYDEDNPDRIRDAERDAKAAGGTGTGR